MYHACIKMSLGDIIRGDKDSIHYHLGKSPVLKERDTK